MKKTLKRNKARGFTLVELMIVVAIIGVLAALAIYGVSKYLGASKSTEAKTALGAIAKGNTAAFNNEGASASNLSDGASSTKSNQICGPASALVPGTVPAGVKFQSSHDDWNNPADVGDGKSRPKGFPCLRFTMDAPQYYQYDYSTADATAGTFTAIARGDVNGDGKIFSEFSLGGVVRDGRLVMNPAIGEKNPDE